MVEIWRCENASDKRVVDVVDVDAQARGGVTVDLDVELQAALLAVGGHIGEARNGADGGDGLRHPLGQSSSTSSDQSVY